MRLILLPLLAAVIQVQTASAEISDDTLRRKIADLHNDNIPGNCQEAMSFLREHSAEKKVHSALLNEFNQTADPQTREECMIVLCHAPGFQPDEKFMRAVLKRMHHHGKPEMMSIIGEPAGDAGAALLVTQLPKFPDLIASEIQHNFPTASLWVQYAVIRAMSKAGLLQSYEKRFSEAYLTTLAKHLQDDETPGNANTATLAFIFLGKIGVPTLRKVPLSSNLQGRQLALALLSHLSGSVTLAGLGDKVHDLGVGISHPEDFDLRKASNNSVYSGMSTTRREPSEEEFRAPRQSSGGPSTVLREFQAELKINYSYAGKTPRTAQWQSAESDREGDTISASERENLGRSQAAKNSGVNGQHLEGKSKIAPIRFSVRVERKAGEADATMTISVEDSATGKALDDFPKIQEQALGLLQVEAGHHVEVVLSPAQAKKIAEGLRGAIVRDEGEPRGGLEVSEYAYLLIGR